MMKVSNVRRACWHMGFVVAAAMLPAGLIGCESYDNGTTKSKTTRTEESPTEKKTTTTTTEKKVEDYR